MFEYFYITKHARDRYQGRVAKPSDNVKSRINRDLRINMIKRIVNIGNKRHVFTLYGKEFVFVYDGKWILKTVIKHRRYYTQKAIDICVRKAEAV